MDVVVLRAGTLGQRDTGDRDDLAWGLNYQKPRREKYSPILRARHEEARTQNESTYSFSQSVSQLLRKHLLESWPWDRCCSAEQLLHPTPHPPSPPPPARGRDEQGATTHRLSEVCQEVEGLPE